MKHFHLIYYFYFWRFIFIIINRQIKMFFNSKLTSWYYDKWYWILLHFNCLFAFSKVSKWMKYYRQDTLKLSSSMTTCYIKSHQYIYYSVKYIIKEIYYPLVRCISTLPYKSKSTTFKYHFVSSLQYNL